jgi:hypothetical protein
MQCHIVSGAMNHVFLLHPMFSYWCQPIRMPIPTCHSNLTWVTTFTIENQIYGKILFTFVNINIMGFSMCKGKKYTPIILAIIMYWFLLIATIQPTLMDFFFFLQLIHVVVVTCWHPKFYFFLFGFPNTKKKITLIRTNLACSRDYFSWNI